MHVFEYVLILLATICLSNLINRFIPVLSVPIIQIALGAIITLLLSGFSFELSPDLFFVLFIAPLIFHVSLLADKKTMWAQRKPILNMSILLVVVTVLAGGYFISILIPAIPLAAAFAMIAAMGPTDDVAVSSVSKRTNIPSKIKIILEGESIVNETSGVVCFQFALAAVLTGSFSLVDATGRFFIVALGGIAVGLLFSWFKYFFIRWIRSLGVENVTLHLLLEILTPFVIYLIAEELGVSGILAIFAAGIAHSVNKDKFNPETVNLNIASESVWSMLSFTLEGLVFVILGTQLPKILTSINQNHSISSWEIVLYILLIVLLILFLRFVWSIFAIKKKNYFDHKNPINRYRAGLIFSLSGARGAVTLASVMSIPVLLSNGAEFPERDLIILIVSGVIVASLLISNFILPLCVEKKAGNDKSAENEAFLEILQNVISELESRITPENKSATAFITSIYHNRSAELHRKKNSRSINRQDERKLRITVCEWEKENIVNMLEHSEVNEYAAQAYLNMLDDNLDKLSKKRFHAFKKRTVRFLHRNSQYNSRKRRSVLRIKIFALMEANCRFVMEKLKQMNQISDNSTIRKLIAEYEFKLSIYQKGLKHSDIDNEILMSVASSGFQIERDNIRTMFENGRISRETAKEMRHNTSLLEVQLKK